MISAGPWMFQSRGRWLCVSTGVIQAIAAGATAEAAFTAWRRKFDAACAAYFGTHA